MASLVGLPGDEGEKDEGHRLYDDLLDLIGGALRQTLEA